MGRTQQFDDAARVLDDLKQDVVTLEVAFGRARLARPAQVRSRRPGSRPGRRSRRRS